MRTSRRACVAALFLIVPLTFATVIVWARATISSGFVMRGLGPDGKSHSVELYVLKLIADDRELEPGVRSLAKSVLMARAKVAIIALDELDRGSLCPAESDLDDGWRAWFLVRTGGFCEPERGAIRRMWEQSLTEVGVQRPVTSASVREWTREVCARDGISAEVTSVDAESYSKFCSVQAGITHRVKVAVINSRTPIIPR